MYVCQIRVDYSLLTDVACWANGYSPWRFDLERRGCLESIHIGGFTLVDRNGRLPEKFEFPFPFLTKTYEMVNDPSTNSIVSWSPINNFSSFVRQLNTYVREKSDIVPLQTLDMESFVKMKSSLNSLENFFRGVSQAFGNGLSYDSIVPSLPSNVNLIEMNAPSGETNVNLQLSLPKLYPCSPYLGDIHSSPGIAESSSYAETPEISAT
ncbi:hypothetical protein BHM03_00018562 [Ensete ventricosum]|nr:hypothetical protein BHM03_00018562 [Ensete ventricosum]